MDTLLRTSELPSLRLLPGRQFVGRRKASRLAPHPIPSRAGSRRNARVMAASSAADGLRKGIAELYDESSGIWERLWGDHMHHGFYDPHVPAATADHRAAQIRMIEEALSFAGVPVLQKVQKNNDDSSERTTATTIVKLSPSVRPPLLSSTIDDRVLAEFLENLKVPTSLD